MNFKKVALLLIVLVLGGLSFQILLGLAPSVVKREMILKNEYMSLEQPEGATLLHYESHRKMTKIWIDAVYEYPEEEENIFVFFDRELSKGRWRKIDYKNFEHEGYMERSVKYQKGKIILSITKSQTKNYGSARIYWNIFLTDME